MVGFGVIKLTRRRRPRHDDPRGIARGFGGSNRLRRLTAWLQVQSTRLNGTGTGQTFTANATNNQLTITGHGFTKQTGPFVVSSTTTLPTPLKENVLYWVSIVDANTVKLHYDFLRAGRAQAEVDITDAGTGTHTLTPATSRQAIFEHLRQGRAPLRIQTETDIDNLI